MATPDAKVDSFRQRYVRIAPATLIGPLDSCRPWEGSSDLPFTRERPGGRDDELRRFPDQRGASKGTRGARKVLRGPTGRAGEVAREAPRRRALIGRMPGSLRGGG